MQGNNYQEFVLIFNLLLIICCNNYHYFVIQYKVRAKLFKG